MNAIDQPVDLPLTPRVLRLLERLNRDFAMMDGHQLVCPQEQETYARLACQAYSDNADKPEILRRAEFLTWFAERVPVSRREDELLVGSKRFASPAWNRILTPEQLEQCGIHGNHGHIIVDYGRVLTDGICGVRKAVDAMPAGENRNAFIQTLEAFATFIRRHGCAELADRPPESFHEALQMTWFIQIFLRAEGNTSAVSFGRFDQFAWPFLQHDLAAGRLDRNQAFELLCCFFMKCCEGGESQNLTVGGNGQENTLSILVLKAMRKLNVWQPSISVRIGPGTSEEFWREALLLCDTGIGMPSFFNDFVVTKALGKLDIPSDRAADWGIVGCYEASPQGDAYPLTVRGGFALPEILWDYLQGSPANGSFEAFSQGFKSFFSEQYTGRILPGFQQRWLDLKRNAVSPFESLCVTGCIESGLAAEEGGARFNLFGVNILGIGTLIDSLLSIKKLIFDEQDFTLSEMTRQLAENFPDQKMLLRCRALSGKFGSDTAESNALAHDLSAFVARTVLGSRLANGVRPYPGFFWFGQDIHRQIAATPDGRLANERPSYGCGPGILLEKSSTTSILNSAACIDHASCACGNPLTLSFNRNEIAGKNGLDIIRQVVESYFGRGGFHLHINVVEAEELKKAREAPERYQNLTVRISGFSARFVSLDKPWQDAIIERTEMGM
jgi:formate C-acetyltransferase